MCGGGGSGGPSAEQLKRDEDLRNLKTQQSVAAINAIFGLSDPSAYRYDNDLIKEEQWINEMLAPKQYEIPVDSDSDTSYLRRSRQPATPQYRTGYAFEGSLPTDDDRTDDGSVMGRRRGYRLSSPSAWGYSGRSTEDLAANLRKAADDIPDYSSDTYLADARKNRASIDAQYGTARTDILDYFRAELDRQKSEAEQALKMTLAQRGLGGGQASISAGADLMGSYNDGLLEATSRADSAVSRLRESDDTARRNLISQIYSGMDSQTALSSATNQMRANIDATKSETMSQALGDIFGGFADRYKLGQYAQGQAAARNGPPVQTAGATVNPSNYSGTQVRY